MELMIEGSFADDAGAGARSGRSIPQRPVDLVHLARYTLGDRFQEREILELFRTQSALSLNRLKASASSKAWQDAAGSIKRSALCIGAWRVAEAAATAETRGAGPQADRRSKLVRALQRRIDETNDFIRMLLVDA